MTLILFLLILSLLVFVHELGHFLMAKRSGILVEEFGFGLPPRIWGKKIGETTYSINLLPIGGFVKLYGEEGEVGTEGGGRKTEGGKRKTGDRGRRAKLAGRAFWEKSILSRLSVILAGVTMNFLLALLVFSITYWVMGIPTKTGQIKILGVSKDSPAALVGLKEGDQVISLDGQKLESGEQFIKLTGGKAGKVIRLEIKRDKDNPCQPNQKVLGGMAGIDLSLSCKEGNLLVSLVPRVNPPADQGPLGVVISEMEMKRYSPYLMPIYGIREGLKESIAWGKTILLSLGQMIKELSQGKVPKDIAGPIGIYQATGIVAKSGYLAILEFIGILSVNLAIINILPFPALDGGRLMLLAVEKIFGRKVTPKIEAWTNNLGMIILLFLLLLVTINDLLRVFSTNHILGK